MDINLLLLNPPDESHFSILATTFDIAMLFAEDWKLARISSRSRMAWMTMFLSSHAQPVAKSIDQFMAHMGDPFVKMDAILGSFARKFQLEQTKAMKEI
jgi:hypothetical protein